MDRGACVYACVHVCVYACVHAATGRVHDGTLGLNVRRSRAHTVREDVAPRRHVVATPCPSRPHLDTARPGSHRAQQQTNRSGPAIHAGRKPARTAPRHGNKYTGPLVLRTDEDTGARAPLAKQSSCRMAGSHAVRHGPRYAAPERSAKREASPRPASSGAGSRQCGTRACAATRCWRRHSPR